MQFACRSVHFSGKIVTCIGLQVRTCMRKLLDTFLSIKIAHEQDTRMSDLYSSHLEISID